MMEFSHFDFEIFCFCDLYVPRKSYKVVDHQIANADLRKKVKMCTFIFKEDIHSVAQSKLT